MTIAKSLRESSFFRFMNRPIGRLMRFGGGLGLLAVGYASQGAVALLLMAFGLAMAATSAVDLCPASAALGGPIRGRQILNREPL